jgi:MFS family permease
VNEEWKEVKIRDLLATPRYLFAAVAGSLSYFIYCFMEPILAIRVKEFALSQQQIALFFIILPLFSFFSCVFVHRLSKVFENRSIIKYSIIVISIGNLLVGPSKTFRLPDELWIMVIGQVVHGIFDPFIYVLALPEMINSVSSRYPADQQGRLNDVSSGLLNMCNGIGQMIGPVYGSLATGWLGF